MAKTPNPQNITPKTPEGEAIRKAFADKFELAAMDFAEVEKRVVARLVGVEGLNEVDEETWKAFFGQYPERRHP